MPIEREWRSELRPYAHKYSDQKARRRVISGPHGFRAVIFVWLDKHHPCEVVCYASPQAGPQEYLEGIGISCEDKMTVAIRAAFAAIRAAYDAHLLGVLASVA